MRIIQTLLSEQQLTTIQLLDLLDDVPQATLYRHLQHLLEGELVEVVDHNKKRGTVEKTYGIRKENLTVSEEEIHQTTPDEHIQHFMTYQAILLADFEQYVKNTPPAQYKQDGLSFSQATLHLNQEELQAFYQEMGDIVQKYMKQKPEESQHSYTLGTVFIPK